MAPSRCALIALLACTACGGARPEAQAPTALPPEPASTRPAPDLSPVPAPADLVMVGRIARPRALFETLAGWAGVPASLEQVLPDELRELGSIVSWDAPVELAAVLDPEASGPELEPLLVVSV